MGRRRGAPIALIVAAENFVVVTLVTVAVYCDVTVRVFANQSSVLLDLAVSAAVADGKSCNSHCPCRLEATISQNLKTSTNRNKRIEQHTNR